MTPLGASITFQTNETYDLDGCAADINSAIRELRTMTLRGRLIKFLSNLFKND